MPQDREPQASAPGGWPSYLRAEPQPRLRPLEVANHKPEKRKLPSADVLYDNYPKSNPDGSFAHPSAVREFENQCAIRVSAALKKSGFDINSYPKVNQSPEGYARAAQGLADYLWKETGPAVVVSQKEFREKHANSFKGIVFFKGKPDTYDHIDVWNPAKERPYGSLDHPGAREVWLFKAP